MTGEVQPPGTFLDPEVVPADVRRRAGRGLVLDGRGRCLVERIHLHADPAQGTWWELPGGGIERRERSADAVVRELAEETGIVDVRVGPVVATRRIRYRGPTGRIVDQHETIHVVDATTSRRTTARPEASEVDDIVEVAWLTPDQLADGRRTDPPEMAHLVAHVLAGPLVPRRLADLDAVAWSDGRDPEPLEPAGARARVVDADGRPAGSARDRGSLVVRDAAPWTPTVQALLRHLEERGFDRAPRPLGVDAHGREAVTYVAGDAGTQGCWAAPLRSDDGMARLGALLRRLREATAGFTPPAGAVWLTGPATGGDHLVGSGGVVAHGDIGWTNVVWDDHGEPSLIDWEYAQPASPLRDLAQAACWLVPLLEFDHEQHGFDAPPDRAARLRALASASDVTVDDVLDAVGPYVAQETARLRTWGGRGIPPWSRYHDGGWIGAFDRITAFVAEHGARLR